MTVTEVSVGVATGEGAAPTGLTGHYLASEALLCVTPERTSLALSEAGEHIMAGHPHLFVVSFPVELNGYWTVPRCEEEAVTQWEDAAAREGWKSNTPDCWWSVDRTVLTVRGVVSA